MTFPKFGFKVRPMPKTIEQRIEDLKRKAQLAYQRRQEALRLYDEEGLTYEAIGARLGGLTKQRIQQLVVEARGEREGGA